MSLFSGAIPELIERLEEGGLQHAYVDGGATITSFLDHGLIDEICVWQAPVLLGGGLPLFGQLGSAVRLKGAHATVFSNDFIQWRCSVIKDRTAAG
ncbi:dihydrofolate reductase family protein [Halioglobus pacificus]|uniref:Bacterial bifunctional deaminase-reductase C-terminal domain-containing protein n=1 Tax=Parahalioglobus pacificus TaxID=930806 RepID=A0A918XE08_9GAMM|nr:dihydrofolate reductase family protein [Halioglobus pacificus]GHD27464.1 hypothetical protein GCM10007053_05780 [Halioglobus pacificus]